MLVGWQMWTPLKHRLSRGTQSSLQPPQAASVTLGIDPEEMGDSSASFNQLGGDSLAAIQFAREVDELCGTHLPVSFVLDHSHSIQDIVDKVGSLRHASMHQHALDARLYHSHTDAGYL